MVLGPIPQSLPVHFFGSRPQPSTSQPCHARRAKDTSLYVCVCVCARAYVCKCMCIQICTYVCICEGVYIYDYFNIFERVYIYISIYANPCHARRGEGGLQLCQGANLAWSPSNRTWAQLAHLYLQSIFIYMHNCICIYICIYIYAIYLYIHIYL